MATHAQVKMWASMQAAIASRDWAALARVAAVLEAELRVIAQERSVRGPGGETARRYHRDGLYAIGWQRMLYAPDDVRAVVTRYNDTLRRLPGGIGRQPPRRPQGG